MTEADPQLLSLLQKIVSPITQVSLTLTVKGVFSPPEQWKSTDEANPNIFGYSIELLNRKFSAGQIHPKIGGQPANQTSDKNKKGGKNPIKQQQKPVQLDPQSLKKQQQWQALPEQQRFHRTSQDPQKMYSLKFAEGQVTQLLEKQALQKLDQTVAEGSALVILVRKPQMSQDQIAKLKKSKPKALNVGQLYEAKYQGVINLTQLQNPGCKSMKQRVKLQSTGDIPADGIKIQCQHAYAYIQITLDKPLSPEVTEIRPNLEEVLPNIENLSRKSISIIQKLKKEITRAVKAVNQEYVYFFSKQKDFADDKKNIGGANSISTLKLNEINRRKQLFLNQFTNSGKYAILKERIGATLKAVIVDKFRKQKIANPISKQQIHRTLSQLNVFCQHFVSQTVDYVLTNQHPAIHEDILLNHEYSKAHKKQSVALVVNQTKEQTQTRIAQEYETINEIKVTQEKLINLVLLNKKNVPSLERYGEFLIRNKQFDTAYEIYKKINQKTNEFNSRFILCLFMVQRRRTKQVLKNLTEIVEEQQIQPSLKYLCTNCLSFMYEHEGDILRSQKYLELSEKYFQLHKNPQLKINPPANPYLEPKPLIPKPQRYSSQLSSAQTQEMWTSFVQFLETNYFYDLLEKILPKIAESDRKKILKIKVNIFNGRYEQCLQMLDQMLERDADNVDLLQMKADICYKYDKIFQCEQVFLLILRLKPSQIQSYKAHLRLGYTYINRKSWEDAKITFEKVCQLKNNCSLGWQGLGVSLLQLGKLKQAEQAFSMSSIYNSLSQGPKTYLKRINQIRNKQNMASYIYLEPKD